MRKAPLREAERSSFWGLPLVVGRTLCSVCPHKFWRLHLGGAVEPQKFKQDSTEKQRHSSRRAQGPGSIFNRFTLTINAVPKKAATFRFAAIVSWIFDSRQSRLGSTFQTPPCSRMIRLKCLSGSRRPLTEDQRAETAWRLTTTPGLFSVAIRGLTHSMLCLLFCVRYFILLPGSPALFRIVDHLSGRGIHPDLMRRSL